MDQFGIDDGYRDVGGGWHHTPPEVRAALRGAMLAGGGAERQPDGGGAPITAPLRFVRHGSAADLDGPAVLALEDGTELDVSAALPPDLPLGYHELRPADGTTPIRLIVAPHRVAPPPDRLRAVAVQLYAARSRQSWGIGDLGDIADLARWAGGHGASGLLLSPLHAPRPGPSPEPSPYYASSRLWRSPLHLRIEDAVGWDPDDSELAELATLGRALDADRLIDREAVWSLKREALARIWSRRRAGDRAFARWRAEQGSSLARYSAFCALAEHHGSGWPDWPAEHRRPDTPGVARFAADHADAVSFHAWLQWQTDRQHRAAATAHPAVSLVHDLAVGAAPDGADGWAWQDVLAAGVRVGAPPDEFAPAGQDWGLPPFVPWRLRDAGYEPLAQLLRASMHHAAGLRVDHVMGLFRLWWVPPGLGAADGGYVRYPSEELLDVLALESVRASTFVVGEDLGTVEDQVRADLADRGVLSYRVGWFEEGGPETWPAQSLASLTTHDLPTVAGVWSGDDDPDGKLSPRLSRLIGDPWPTSAAEAVERAHRRLATAGSAVVAATLEDLLAVPERPNVPGTTTERPNWSVALPVAIDDFDATPPAAAVLDGLVAG